MDNLLRSFPMVKGTRWVYEVVAFNPKTRIATLEHDSRNIRDVSTDEEGKPLDPAWREIVPLPPPPDDDCDDCEEDAFSRPQGHMLGHIARLADIGVPELVEFPPHNGDLIDNVPLNIYGPVIRLPDYPPEPEPFTDEQFPIVMAIEPAFKVERTPDFKPFPGLEPAPFAWDFVSHRLLHASSPDPSCPFCKGRA